MSTLYKRPNSPYWFVRFQLDGKVHRVSTKEIKKSEAEKALVRSMAQAKGTTTVDSLMDEVFAHLATLPQQKQDKKRQEIAARLLQGLTAKTALSEAWKSWELNPRKKNPTPATMDNYRVAWDRFASWMGTTQPKVTHLHEISPQMAENYVSHLWAANITPSTYNAHLTFLKSCFNVLKTAGGLTLNPWADIPRMQKNQESRRPLTPDELCTICSKATGALRYMIAVGIYTGMRLGDVCTLKWDELDLKNGIIERVPLKTRRNKKAIRFPIHTVLLAMLEELKDKSSGPYLFPDEAVAYRKDRSTTSKNINAFFKGCGIATTEASDDEHRRRSIARAGFHSLRHSFVSLCAANNVPQVAIMEMVGHGSPAMTRLYSHAGDAEKAKAIMALPDVSLATSEPVKACKGKGRKSPRGKQAS